MTFPTKSDVQAGLDAYNRFVARIWSSKLDEIAVRLKAEAEELVRKDHRVVSVESIDLEVTNPPRLEFDGALDRPGRLNVRFELPGAGSWTLRVRARIRPGRIFSRKGNVIEAAIERLRITASLDLDRTSPFAARYVGSEVKVELGGVKVSASNFVLKVFSTLLDFFLDILKGTIEHMARRALARNLPDVKAVRAIEALDLASEALRFSDPAPNLADLADNARNVSARIARAHTPFDTVLTTFLPRDNPDGAPVRYASFEDSAIWTGHFLIGELFRFQVSRDADALANVGKALDGLASLIHLTDDPGLLSRVQVPVTESAVVAELEAAAQAAGHGAGLFTSVDGKFRSIGQITRDQYVGAFFGAGLAAVLLEDSALRERARDITRAMAAYLIKTTFCPTEATADPTTGRKLTSASYVADPWQVLAILQAAQAIDAASFKQEFDALFPMWSIVWFFNWFDTLDPNDSYFKFNLQHSSAFLLLSLEADAERRSRLALGLQTLRSPLRFHAQAWFNLVELVTLQDSELSRPRAEIERETRHLIAQMFDRPAFILPADLPNDPSIQKVTYRGLSGKGNESIAQKVVDLPRRPGTDFLWQRSPFALQVIWKNINSLENPAMRSPNVDIVLPYWLARKIGL